MKFETCYRNTIDRELSESEVIALCAWSNPEGAWCVLGISEDKAKIAGLFMRLTYFLDDGLVFQLVGCRSFEQDDIDAAVSVLGIPNQALFVRPDACNE